MNDARRLFRVSYALLVEEILKHARKTYRLRAFYNRNIMKPK
jgi:hypothetical protein